MEKALIISENFDPTDPKPGVYNISNEVYHASFGISSSGIKKILQSPLHYYDAYLDENKKPFTETPAMSFGTMTHKFILENKDFFNEYSIVPIEISSMHAAKKERKLFYEKIKESGKKPITTKEQTALSLIKKQIDNSKSARQLFVDGYAELSFFWIDTKTGMLCKCRPDYFISDTILVDLKTTQDGRKDALSKTCASFDYHIQAAFYSSGMQAVTGMYLPMRFVAVESSRPYAVNVFDIDNDDIESAHDQCDKALEIYAQCLASGEWPGYSCNVKVINLPIWKKMQKVRK